MPKANKEELRPEHDFLSATRGRYANATKGGYTMIIREADGRTTTKEVVPKRGGVVLDPDVEAYFPDSKSVNDALRCLIPLLSPPRRLKGSKTRPAAEPNR